MAVLSLTARKKYFGISGKIHPISALMVYFLLYLFILLWAAWKYDLWFPTTSHNGLLTEPSAIINDLLIQPCIVAYYFWTEYSIENLLLAIKEAFRSENHYNKVINQLNQRLNNKGLTISFWILSISFAILAYAAYTNRIRWGFQDTPLATWWSEHPIIYLIASPQIVFSCYALLMTSHRLISLVRCLKDLFDTDRLRILVKEKDGGLGAIGKFSANLGWFIGVIFTMFSLAALQAPHNFYKDGLLMAGLGLYILIAPILFFSPSISAHHAMVAYKRKQRLIVSNESQRVFDWLQELLSKDVSETRNLREKGEYLNKDLDMIDKFPTFPFDSSALKYFVITYVPLIPTLIKLILDLIENLF